jgi:phage terminase small subunit
MKPLTPRQQKFVAEFLKDLNVTNAAKRCGLSAKTAGVAGHRMLKIISVEAAINEALKRRQKKAEITQERVLKEIAAVALSDITRTTEIRNGRVSVRDTTNWDDESRLSVRSVQETTTKDGGSLRVDMHDKMAALKLLAAHVGIGRYVDDERAAQDSIGSAAGAILSALGELARDRK